MNGMNNHHDHYRDFKIQREQLLRAARHEQLLRLAVQRSPQTLQTYLAALAALLTALFR